MDSPATQFGGLPALDWPTPLLAALPDLVVAMDPQTTILWCNDASRQLLGLDPQDVIGRSFVEFVHPEDLARAAEVITLTANGAFDTYPRTPASYRVQNVLGDWVELEVNASTGEDGSMLILARPGGDLVVLDRLLAAVSAGASFEEQVEIVMDLGRWRHPDEGYAIRYQSNSGEIETITSNIQAPMLDVSAYQQSPWDLLKPTGEAIEIDPLPSELTQLGYVACVAVPVPDPDHEEGASIAIWTTQTGPSISGHRYALTNMARALELVLKQRAQMRRLEIAAQIDSLTGVCSRSRFLELLNRAGDNLALLYVDLDGFKAINDDRGHSAGDATLVAAAQALVRFAPVGSIVGRLGGDEFVIICPSGNSQSEAESLAQTIVDGFGSARSGELADVHVSIGIAVGNGSQTPTEVLHAADTALLQAKSSGRGRWVSAPTAM